jgi:hypothetical protein
MRFPAALVLVLLLGSLILSPASALGIFPLQGQPQDSAPLSWEAYWSLVERTRDAVRDLRQQSTENAGAQLDALVPLAVEWEAVHAVTLADGVIVSVEPTQIPRGLRDPSVDLTELETLLDTLLNARDESPRSVADDAREKLAVILADPQFQYPPEQPSPLEDWFNRLLDWLFNRSGAGGNGGTINIPFSLFPYLAVFLLIATLVYMLRGTLAGLVSEARLEENGRAGDEMLTAEGAFQKAQLISAGGDYRTAARYLYLSSLLLLDERGLLRYDRSKTNREYLRNLSGRLDLLNPLRAVIETFDRVWYGFKPLDKDSFGEYVERVNELREQKPE